MKTSATLLVAAAAAVSAELQPIVMKGSKFFYENGTQFYMKGVAYQQDTAAAGATNDETTKYIDPLADADICKRDVPLLQELGTNTIRTYAIDPTADHSACMKLLDEAGIYVISDLSEPALSINRDEGAWDTELYKRYTAVVDELAQYSNVIGFFAGNEVSNNKTNTPASAYVKAAVRDTKKHIKDKGYRWLGVGYAANDDVDIREEIAQYFNCGDDNERIDYWGYNIYSWCGTSDMQKSGYADQVKFFEKYSVPVFFAEYGCNEPGGADARVFDETTALYSSDMTGVFSGGIVYMYFQEANDYGLVEIDKGGKASTMNNYNELKTKVNEATPSAVDMGSYKPTNTPESCPDLTSNWQANSALPPSPDSDLCACMVAAAECVPVSSLKEKDFGDIFGYICGAKPEVCVGINGNATTGIYGAYSMCTDTDKLTYVLDAYYKAMSKSSSACDFDGDATTQRASSQASCSAALASASSANEVAATATAATGSKSTGGSDDSFGNPTAQLARVFTFGDFAVGAYLLVAGAVGAGMVLL